MQKEINNNTVLPKKFTWNVSSVDLIPSDSSDLQLARDGSSDCGGVFIRTPINFDKLPDTTLGQGKKLSH